MDTLHTIKIMNTLSLIERVCVVLLSPKELGAMSEWSEGGREDKDKPCAEVVYADGM